MSFLVRDERYIESDTIAREFEESDDDDQADLLNEIGAALDAHIEPDRMEFFAEAIAKHLDKDGQAFILAIAKALQPEA